MNYILDTNVISELVAARPSPAVVDFIQSIEPEGVFLSVIAVGEINKGIEKLPNSERKASLGRWMQEDLLTRFSGHILGIDTQTMLLWGKLVARLERLRRPISAIDSLLAATTQQWGYTLVTRNIAHFQDTGIDLLNPWD